MAQYMISDETLTDIADAIRKKTKSTNAIQTKNMAEMIDNFQGEGGIDTSDATAIASDILSDKTAYVNGKKITGTIETVPTATPSINISSSGLITASITQSEGYVTGNTETVTQQLPTQSAKTIKPNTSNQIAIVEGVYTTGEVTVEGDSNLVAENIAEGVSIFGVTGTHSGGGNTEAEDGLITRTLTSITNDRVTVVGYQAFQYCTKLTSIDFPKVHTLNQYAFAYCSNLTTLNLPSLSSVLDYAFINCSKLSYINFPKLLSLPISVFANCRSLATADFSVLKTISNYAFNSCVNLISLFLRASSICRLSSSFAFYSTPIAGYSTQAGRYGSIYVPKSLLTSYKTTTNWAYFSSRFAAIEDLET